MEKQKVIYGVPKIERIIFSKPATIVFWEDGTKTIVKQHGEDYDEEKAVFAAITKKALGNKYDYFQYIDRKVKQAIRPVKK